MSRGFRLGAVLRARDAQAQVAKGALAMANSRVDTAAEDVRRRTATLAACAGLTDGSSAGFVAAMSLRSSLAAELSTAERGRSGAQAEAADRAAEWTAAAVRRKSLERLAERHHDAVRADELRMFQREIDDRAKRTTADTDTEGGLR